MNPANVANLVDAVLDIAQQAHGAMLVSQVGDLLRAEPNLPPPLLDILRNFGWDELDRRFRGPLDAQRDAFIYHLRSYRASLNVVGWNHQAQGVPQVPVAPPVAPLALSPPPAVRPPSANSGHWVLWMVAILSALNNFIANVVLLATEPDRDTFNACLNGYGVSGGRCFSGTLLQCGSSVVFTVTGQCAGGAVGAVPYSKVVEWRCTNANGTYSTAKDYTDCPTATTAVPYYGITEYGASCSSGDKPFYSGDLGSSCVCCSDRLCKQTKSFLGANGYPFVGSSQYLPLNCQQSGNYLDCTAWCASGVWGTNQQYIEGLRGLFLSVFVFAAMEVVIEGICFGVAAIHCIFPSGHVPKAVTQAPMSFLLVYLLRGRVEWHYTTFGRVVLLMRLIDNIVMVALTAALISPMVSRGIDGWPLFYAFGSGIAEILMFFAKIRQANEALFGRGPARAAGPV
eukprot:EG_transcript_8659